jgi:hypothetical protein
MPSNEYHFVTHWVAPGATLEEVYAVLSDVESLPVWWPAVYLSVTPVSGTGDANGIGREFDLHTKGWLPYTLKWRLTVTENHPPYGSTIEASGDFNGRGIWSFVPQDDEIDIFFDWKLTADKPLLKYLSPILKPLFSLNHQWAMAQGLTSLLQELERRRTIAPMKKPIPPPPQPTTWQPFAVLSAVVAVGFLVVTLLRRK